MNRIKIKRTLLGSLLMVLCLTALTTRPSAANNPTQISPEFMARLQQRDQDLHDAQVALKAKDYATAEADFRKVISFDPDGESYFGLAQIYTAQGHTAKALQAYRALFHPADGVGMGGTFLTRAHLEYALLLNRVGRWPEAVASYQTALRDLPAGEQPRIDASFSAETPQPAGLEAAVHLGLGVDANRHCTHLGEFEDDRAFSEYERAMQLAPDWATANYYYGYGWKRLAPKARAKAASAEQVKAALQMAAVSGDVDVKKAAEHELAGIK